jgi:glycosyltransferase involved in cell wall biosynthesis
MTPTPRVSIGLPVYNGENYLREALDALLAQTFEDFELIISDNASTDATESICREYAAKDPRIRYVRQQRNLGAIPNQAMVFALSQGEYFKLAAHDDLYDRDLIRSCVAVLDAEPDVVLCHADMAYIDGSGALIRDYDYAIETDSPEAAVRFRSLLHSDGGDDEYGVVRSSVLRRVRPCGSFHNSGRPYVAEIALQGPFRQVPRRMYFRRDHPERGDRHTTIAGVCANLDPRREGQSSVRLVAEYLLAYVSVIERSPISRREKLACHRHLAGWLLGKAGRGGGAAVRTLVTGERDGSIKPGVPDGVGGAR